MGFFSAETTADTESKITWLNKASFQLQTIIITIIGYATLLVLNNSLFVLHVR